MVFSLQFTEPLDNMYQGDFPTYLGIPVPESLRALVKKPPACHPTSGDVTAVGVTRELGAALRKPEDEILQAQNLASGFSDIVIILQRPLHRSQHNYDATFSDFVEDCPTLAAVDELIRFASKGTRSIHSVTVLDAFPFQPDKVGDQVGMKQERTGHEAIARILKAKKPKVILRCHREKYWDEWLKCIELLTREYKMELKEINITEDYKTVILQSFHPSCAVNYADYRPEYRALLMYHFVAAFSELSSEFSLPDDAERIRMICLRKGERIGRDISEYEPWQAAFRVSEALEKAYEGPPEAQFVEIIDQTPFEHCIAPIKGFNAMYKSLGQFLGSSNNHGCLGIARVVLFFGEQHFRKDPLYKNTMSWLILRGNEQKDWFPSTTHQASSQRPLEDDLSRLQISGRPLLSDIQKLTEEARIVARQASETPGSTKNPGVSLYATTMCIRARYDVLVRKYSSSTSMSDIKNAMAIRAQLTPCKIFLSAVLDPNDALE